MDSFKYEVPEEAQIVKLAPSRCEPRQPVDNEILVRVEASSLNFHDFLVVEGMIKVPAGRVPLSDGVGIVEACGPNAKRFAPGTRVMGTFFPDWLSGDPSPSHVGRMRGEHVDGFAASYVTMADAGFTRVPQGLTPVEAATLPCAALTAWRALFVEGNLRPGETVLIQGSGGVSLFALQFARVAGAQVIATTSIDAKAEKLKALGAHVVVDRNNPQWGDTVREHVPGGVDHVVEVAGGDLSQSLQSLRIGGRLCLVGVLSRKSIQFPPIHMIHANRRIGAITVGSRDHQEAMVAAVELHGIKPVVDCVYPLSELRDAFAYFQTQQHFGKIAIAAGPTGSR